MGTMTGVAVKPLLLFSAALYFSYAVEGYPRICAFNRANAVNNEKKCKYGWEMDPCGTKLCTKGPGEVCGGKNERYGICGEGLMCSNCQRCQGCSLKTFECFDDRQCIWSVP